MSPLCPQIDRYAQRDLKKGLHLYDTPGNVGLTNAWSIIQTDVSVGCTAMGVGGASVGLWANRNPQGQDLRLGGTLGMELGQDGDLTGGGDRTLWTGSSRGGSLGLEGTLGGQNFRWSQGVGIEPRGGSFRCRGILGWPSLSLVGITGVKSQRYRNPLQLGPESCRNPLQLGPER